jgi:hypothetical protein
MSLLLVCSFCLQLSFSFSVFSGCWNLCIPMSLSHSERFLLFSLTQWFRTHVRQNTNALTVLLHLRLIVRKTAEPRQWRCFPTSAAMSSAVEQDPARRENVRDACVKWPAFWAELGDSRINVLVSILSQRCTPFSTKILSSCNSELRTLKRRTWTPGHYRSWKKVSGRKLGLTTAYNICRSSASWKCRSTYCDI